MEPSPPEQEPAIRTLARPADTNANGDIFGGWLMSHMDIAGATVAIRRSRMRVATVAVDAMAFLAPVFVGDLVSFYGTLVRVGRSSMRVRVEAWAQRALSETRERVTEGVFTYVALGPDRRPSPVPPEDPPGDARPGPTDR